MCCFLAPTCISRKLSTVYSDDIDTYFTEDYEDLSLLVTCERLLMTDLVDNRSLDKIGIEDFKKDYNYVSERDTGTIFINGGNAAMEIAKSLERKGLFKIKGDKIRWKKLG